VSSRGEHILCFQGWISCRRDAEGPLGLVLVGRTKDRPEEPVQVAFACAAPSDLPDALEDAAVERLGPRQHRISSGERSWTLDAVAHVHREVAGAFYKALPPRPVPWRKRLFWRALLALAGHPAGRWLLMHRR
jgi:hypothetical protein